MARWVCDKDHRHVWEAKVARRALGRGCPVCSGSKVIAGVNDLATTHPDLAKQWSANNAKSATEVSYGSNKPAVWVCERGHEWEESPNKRSALGYGCPICSGKRVCRGVNDLATVRPDLAARVHPSSKIRPEEVTVGSGKKLTWVCSEDPSHIWDASVCDVAARGWGCPVCSGRRTLVGVNDLVTTHPHLASEWDASNPPMSKYHAGSHTRVLWRCSLGHVWRVSVRDRAVRGSGCPVCSGSKVLPGFNDLATKMPGLAKEWSRKNPNLPNSVAVQSNKPVWWECGEGHEWFVSPNNRVTYNTGCPHCARTNFSSTGEKELAAWVSEVWTGEVVRNTRSTVKGHELDIYLPEQRVAIEFNGIYFHSDKFRDPMYHHTKMNACRNAGVRLIHVWEHDWRDRQRIVKRMLSKVMGVSDERRVGARSTTAVRLTEESARAFFDTNHIQGAPRAATCFGLVHGGEVIAAIALKKQKRAGIISRYATSCSVPGGFTKLLKFAEQWAVGQGIVQWETFADLSFSRGDLYIKAGFLLSGEIPPDYRYARHGSLHHKFMFRKDRFERDPSLKYKEGLTERELANLNGLLRVYDCGKLRFVKGISGGGGERSAADRRTPRVTDL